MFFIGIFGTGEDSREIRTFPNIICPCCGRYTQAKLVFSCHYFHIFFIPIIRYRKKYLVKPACGCSLYEAEKSYGEELKTAAYLDMSRLKLLHRRNLCKKCQRELGAEFEFCPYCGERQ